MFLARQSKTSLSWQSNISALIEVRFIEFFPNVSLKQFGSNRPKTYLKRCLFFICIFFFLQFIYLGHIFWTSFPEMLKFHLKIVQAILPIEMKSKIFTMTFFSRSILQWKLIPFEKQRKLSLLKRKLATQSFQIVKYWTHRCINYHRLMVSCIRIRGGFEGVGGGGFEADALPSQRAPLLYFLRNPLLADRP